MTLLVTGGAGFIGSHLVEQLVGRGDDVVCLDNFDDYYDPDQKRENLKACLGSPRLRLEIADIRDERRLHEVFDTRGPFDAVVHLAALAGVRASVKRAQDYLSVNVLGTERVLALAAEHDTPRLIFASSSTVYGEAPRALREQDACGRTLSPYGASKAAAEALCHAYHHLHGMRVLCLRLFSVYGSRLRPDLAMYRFAEAIAEERPLPLFGDGSARRDFTFVSDVVSGVLAALEADFAFECVNLGNRRPVPISSLIELLEHAFGTKAQIDVRPAQTSDALSTCADIARAQELLSYDPRVPLEQGVPLFVSWFQQQRAARQAAGDAA